jgi:DMSO/TMAO reductase YedYZ molybdopterin-dependent catalytic subunit
MVNRLLVFVFSALCSPITPAPAQEPQASLRVVGLKGQTRLLSAQDLRSMPQATIAARAGRDSGSFSGVALAAILERVGVPLGDSLRGAALASYVLIEARDGYRVVFALPELSGAFTDRVILLAHSRDGQPLPPAEGPFRVVVPGEKRLARWIRQVTSIQVVALPRSHDH